MSINFNRKHWWFILEYKSGRFRRKQKIWVQQVWWRSLLRDLGPEYAYWATWSEYIEESEREERLRSSRNKDSNRRQTEEKRKPLWGNDEKDITMWTSCDLKILLGGKNEMTQVSHKMMFHCRPLRRYCISKAFLAFWQLSQTDVVRANFPIDEKCSGVGVDPHLEKKLWRCPESLAWTHSTEMDRQSLE